MVKKTYDPYTKASLYGHGGLGTVGHPQGEKTETPKKGWLQTRKERKGSPGRGQKARSAAFQRSGR